ncbi:thymidine kinase [Mumia sp. zg.B17]|nr:thymidine kinase [Mumia sp. zg.B17]
MIGHGDTVASCLVASLLFFTGTMDNGKSTLALQTNHNHAARGRVGRIFTSQDRAGDGRLSSRLGLSTDAIEVDPDFDFWDYVVRSLTGGGRIDYLICDEAQFYTTAQVEALARITDELQIDVFAFGILTDFRTRMFEGSVRLVELADRIQPLQVEALCWCGKRATHNARTVNGVMVTEGDQIVIGDVDEPGFPTPQVGYEVLCRQHHRRRMTTARARAVTTLNDPLPFNG